jgi:uncharacterized membrane protein
MISKSLLILFLIPLFDIPWLLYQNPSNQEMFYKIQGKRPIEFRIIYAIPVYVALAYLLSRQTNVTDAFLTGAATYAVYDFTCMAVLKDYYIETAVMDVIWGGILFAAVHVVAERAKQVFKLS